MAQRIARRSCMGSLSLRGAWRRSALPAASRGIVAAACRRPGLFDAEEPPAVPARAGDGTRDPGQRAMGLAIPHEPLRRDRHLVHLALPFADETRAGLDAVRRGWRPPAARHDPSDELIEALLRLSVEPAEHMFLQSVRDGSRHEVPSHELGKRDTPELEEALPESVEAETAQGGDLGVERIGVIRARHDDQPACEAVAD